MALIKSVMDEYGKIDVPKLKELLLSKAPDTQLKNIHDDPVYRDQQNAADAQLGDVIDSGGLTLADKAALNAIRNKTARTEAAGRNAITNQMAARGTLDSGAQLAMQLQGNQQSANGLAAADEATAGQAQARAFEAIRERARNAGQGLDRDYRRQSDAARAQDAINQGNNAIANTALMHNAGLAQQNFQNQMQLAQAKAGPAYAMAGAHGANAKDTQQQYQGYGNMAAEALKSTNNTGSKSQGLGYDDAAGRNTPGWQDPSASEWNPYPGSSSDALNSEPTKSGGRQIIGYDADGRPIYGTGQPEGQNF